MLAMPLVVGVVAAGPAWVDLPLTAFWFTGYLAFHAAGLWLKSGRRARYLPPARTYALLAVLFGAFTLALDPTLVRWLPLFVVPLVVGLVASARRDDRSLWSGVATSAGSSLMVLVAYDAGGGTDWGRAWTLTGIVAAYLVGTVLYVKSMIRERDDERYQWLSGLAHAAATVAMIPVGAGLVLVFALLTVRAAAMPAFRVRPAVVGAGELVATVVVAVTALLAT